MSQALNHIAQAVDQIEATSRQASRGVRVAIAFGIVAAGLRTCHRERRGRRLSVIDDGRIASAGRSASARKPCGAMKRSPFLR
jgi:hypothetical protein